MLGLHNKFYTVIAPQSIPRPHVGAVGEQRRHAPRRPFFPLFLSIFLKAATSLTLLHILLLLLLLRRRPRRRRRTTNLLLLFDHVPPPPLCLLLLLHLAHVTASRRRILTLFAKDVISQHRHIDTHRPRTHKAQTDRHTHIDTQGTKDAHREKDTRPEENALKLKKKKITGTPRRECP